VVTGGSTGIGLAIARDALKASARVTLIARDSAKLAAAARHLENAAPGARIATFSADVSIDRQITGVLREAEDRLGPIDVLVTSAGIAHPGYFEALSAEMFERTMAVNYFGTVYALKAVLPGMRQRRQGAVVLVSSGAGLFGFFGYTAYAPSKFAVRGLAESLRAELQGSGVHVSVVYPPDTDTPQLAAENATKPVETKAITQGGGLWTAEAVARVTWAGVARRKFAITPGLPVTALAWCHSLLAPLLHWHFDRLARKARAQREPAPRERPPSNPAR
jgi:3-dehydrosphinganine reductase